MKTCLTIIGILLMTIMVNAQDPLRNSYQTMRDSSSNIVNSASPGNSYTVRFDGNSATCDFYGAGIPVATWAIYTASGINILNEVLDTSNWTCQYSMGPGNPSGWVSVEITIPSTPIPPDCYGELYVAFSTSWIDPTTDVWYHPVHTRIY